MNAPVCIFDLDGTLIDSLADLAQAMNAALKENGFAPHPTEAYRRLVGSGAAVLVNRAIGREDAGHSPEQEAVLAAFGRYYEAHCLDQTRPYEGILPLLSALQERGVRCAVLSNKPEPFTRQIVEALFPASAFALIRGKREGVPRKPDPTAVREILRELSCPEDGCVYIGDSDVDMQTASNAGVFKIGVTWGFRGLQELLQSGADAIAQTPGDILTILEERL